MWIGRKRRPAAPLACLWLLFLCIIFVHSKCLAFLSKGIFDLTALNKWQPLGMPVFSCHYLLCAPHWAGWSDPPPEFSNRSVCYHTHTGEEVTDTTTSLLIEPCTGAGGCQRRRKARSSTLQGDSLVPLLEKANLQRSTALWICWRFVCKLQKQLFQTEHCRGKRILCLHSSLPGIFFDSLPDAHFKISNYFINNKQAWFVEIPPPPPPPKQQWFYDGC